MNKKEFTVKSYAIGLILYRKTVERTHNKVHVQV